MRPAITFATLAFAAVLASGASAQPAPRAPSPARPAAPQPAAPPPIFPCRTETEACFLGVVIGAQLAVIFTNAPGGQAIGTKLVDAVLPDGTKLDLAPHAGRVVMLAGTYDPASGVKGELVEVAGPLLSLIVKAQLGGGSEAGPGAPPGPRGRR